MHKLNFNIKNAVKNLFSKKLLNIIIVFSIAAGMFFPIIFVAGANYYVNTYSKTYFKDIDKTGLIDIVGEYTDDSQIGKFVKKSSLVKDFSYLSMVDATFKYNDTAFLSKVHGFSDNYFDTTKLDVVSGRLPTTTEIKENKNICLINVTALNSGLGYAVGQDILINNKTFKIIGIIRDTKLYATALVNDTVLSEMIKGKKVSQYLVYVFADNEQEISTILSEIKSDSNFEIISKETGREREAFIEYQLSLNLRKKFVFGIGLLLFSIIGISMIMRGKIENQIYDIAVKKALGQSEVWFFFENFVQLFALIQIAMCIDFVLINAFLPQIQRLVLIIINYQFFVMIEVVAVAVSAIIATIIAVIIKRKNLIEMLKT